MRSMNYMQEIHIQLCSEEQKREKVPDEELTFGKIFTDHMFLMKYKDGKWCTPKIMPYQNFSLDPAAMVLHYGQEIFEGMKAYINQKSGSVYIFRPHENAERFNVSAERMCMPAVNKDLFVKAIVELIKIDREWVPKTPGTTLYIRPTMIATETALGVHASREYYFYIILSPVGPYFSTGFSPTKIYVADKHVRTSIGGTGEAKTGGNYASTLYETQIAKEAGYSQVLWLDAKERRYVEEVGAMNIMFVINNEIFTPPLDGTILQGITRKSVIHLAKNLGYTVNEESIEIKILIDQIEKGHCTEAFGTGTAASITPVGALFFKNKEYAINGLEVGPITKRLYEELIGIQTGKKEDKNNWRMKVI